LEGEAGLPRLRRGRQDEQLPGLEPLLDDPIDRRKPRGQACGTLRQALLLAELPEPLGKGDDPGHVERPASLDQSLELEDVMAAAEELVYVLARRQKDIEAALVTQAAGRLSGPFLTWLVGIKDQVDPFQGLELIDPGRIERPGAGRHGRHVLRALVPEGDCVDFPFGEEKLLLLADRIAVEEDRGTARDPA